MSKALCDQEIRNRDFDSGGAALLPTNKKGSPLSKSYSQTPHWRRDICVYGIRNLGYLFAVIGTVVVYRRTGAPRTPFILLVASVITVLHGFITGSLGILLFFIVVAWFEFGWDRLLTRSPSNR